MHSLVPKLWLCVATGVLILNCLSRFFQKNIFIFIFAHFLVKAAVIALALKRIVSLSIVNLEMDEIEPEISWWDKSIVCINYIQKSSVVHLPHICSQPRWRAKCSKVAKAALPCPRILHLTLCTVRASVKLFSHFVFNQNYSIGHWIWLWTGYDARLLKVFQLIWTKVLSYFALLSVVYFSPITSC